MKINRPSLVFLVTEIVIALFILSTIAALPTTIATHFNGTGLPNGFMEKPAYLAFVLVLSIAMPVGVVGFIALALRMSQSRINIPNREFWLSPEHKQATLHYLYKHIAWLGTQLSLFMGFVHWAIVQANSVQPAQIPARLMLLGTGLMLASMGLWIGMLMMRFGRLPKA